MKINGVFGRLLAANLAVLIFLSVFMSYIIHKSRRLNTLLEQVNSVELPVIERVDRLNGTVQKQAEFREKYVISKDADFLERYRDYCSEAVSIISELDVLISDIDKDRAFQELEEAYSKFNTENEKYISARGRTVGIPSYTGVSEALIKLRGLAAGKRKESLELSGILAGQMRTASLVFVLSGGVLVVLLAFVNTKSIVRPIRKLRDSTHQVAKGVYPENIDSGGPAEISGLADDFRVMVKRLRESDELRTEFIGNVSHELKTPLTSIREASAMLREDYFKTDSESSEKLLDIISTESDRMINSVNNILEITRLDIAQAAYEFEDADIGTIAEAAIQNTAPIAARRNISVISAIDASARADREKLAVVFVNLIANALKYSGEGTTVRLSSERVGDRLRVCVADEGAGIAQEELGLIFERYRLGSNRSFEYKGSGLGLAICRKIIEKHGGRIWAESGQGQGSRFYFTLPLC